MSAEPGRTAPYASDLRWRVVWQYIALGLSFRKIAANLSISVGTAHNTFQRFQASGGVDPKHVCTRDKRLRKLDNHHRLYIIGLILDSPDLTLTKVVSKVQEITGIFVGPCLHYMPYTCPTWLDQEKMCNTLPFRDHWNSGVHSWPTCISSQNKCVFGLTNQVLTRRIKLESMVMLYVVKEQFVESYL